MRGIEVPLGQDDEKARTLMLSSLTICAHNHIISRMLLERFAGAKGPYTAIVGDWYNLSAMRHYDSTVQPAATPLPAHRTHRVLVYFVRRYLDETKDAVVVSENWAAERADNWLCPPPRLAFLGDNEVYHILTPEVSDPELIEDSITSRHHWQTGVCSSSTRVPTGDDVTIEWVGEIVANARHIFVPAFDGSGYLVWSPEA